MSEIPIVAVDDDPFLLKLLERRLGKAGYRVRSFSDPRQALEFVLRTKPVLVLVDWEMPGMTGIDLCREIRRACPECPIYVLLLTASEGPERISTALGAGADDYLSKSAHEAELLARIRAGVRILKLLASRDQQASELEAIIENNPAGIVVVDAETRRVVRINQAAREMTGVSLDEALGQPCERFLCPDPDYAGGQGMVGTLVGGTGVEDLFLDGGTEALWNAVRAGGVWKGTIITRGAEGDPRTEEVTIAPVRDPSGQVRQFVAIKVDVTERTQSEIRLRQAYAETEQLLAAIPSVLIGVNGEDVVSVWNEVAEATFQIPSWSALELPFRDCGLEWDWEPIQEAIAQCRRERRTIHLHEVRYRRPDGSQGYLALNLNPLPGEHGDGKGVLLVATDITERRALESQLAQSQKLESIGQLAAGIAHEINTPTQFVGDNTRFLQDAFNDLAELLGKYDELVGAARQGNVTEELLSEVEAAVEKADLEYLLEEIPQAIAQSLEGVQRVSSIVRAMKEFSHPDLGEKAAADLNKAIESTVTVARNEWKYVAEMELDLDPQLPPVPCRVGDLNQAVLNIIVNAAHAIGEVLGERPEEKGRIRISTRRDGEWAEIRISDTGPGIPEAIRTRIFDPFFTTKEVGKGTGQGLAIARSVVVDKHQGTIAVESEVGQGTTFIIRLPLKAAGEPAAEEPEHETADSVCG